MLSSMYSYCLRLCFLVGFYISALAEVSAGAWNLPALEPQIIITSAVTKADTIFDNSRDGILIDSFSKQETRLYSEIGLTNSLMFVGQAGYQSIDFVADGKSIHFKDWDETKLGLQYQVLRKEGLAASLQGSVIFDGGLDDTRLNLGGANNEIELRALYGRSKKLSGEEPEGWVWFYDIQGASRFDLKLNTISRWQVDLTAGVKPSEKWMGLAQIYLSKTESQNTQGTGHAVFFTPSTEQAKAELSFAYQFKPKRYAQIGFVRTVAGRNIVQETGAFFSLWQKF